MRWMSDGEEMGWRVVCHRGGEGGGRGGLLSFVWPADSVADKAHLISAPESRANTAQRPRRVTYRTDIKSSFSVWTVNTHLSRRETGREAGCQRNCGNWAKRDVSHRGEVGLFEQALVCDLIPSRAHMWVIITTQTHRQNKCCTSLQTTDMLKLYVSSCDNAVLEVCLGLSTENNLVRVRKRSCFLWKHLVLSPQTRLENAQKSC